MEKPKDKIIVLLIDSNQITRIYFRDIFWIHGHSHKYEIETADSIEQASEMIADEETRPDIIFFDILTKNDKKKIFPLKEGSTSFNFLKKLKDDKELSNIKIILYSDFKEEILKKEFKEFKIDGYIEKGNLLAKEIITFTDKIYGFDN